jgi:hypothetical protein
MNNEEYTCRACFDGRVCGGAMRPGKAMAHDYGVARDGTFYPAHVINSDPKLRARFRGCTMTRGPAYLTDVLKCEHCGRSVQA